VKNLELLVFFLQSFAIRFFKIKYSERDLLNMSECFFYPLFSSLDDSLEDFFQILSTLCLIPLEKSDLDKTVQYLKNVNFETQIQSLFKYILTLRFLTHKFFDTKTMSWSKNIFYEHACKKSFLILHNSKHIV